MKSEGCGADKNTALLYLQSILPGVIQLDALQLGTSTSISSMDYGFKLPVTTRLTNAKKYIRYSNLTIRYSLSTVYSTCRSVIPSNFYTSPTTLSTFRQNKTYICHHTPTVP
jgi:hypothetical protein